MISGYDVMGDEYVACWVGWGSFVPKSTTLVHGIPQTSRLCVSMMTLGLLSVMGSHAFRLAPQLLPQSSVPRLRTQSFVSTAAHHS